MTRTRSNYLHLSYEVPEMNLLYVPWTDVMAGMMDPGKVDMGLDGRIINRMVIFDGTSLAYVRLYIPWRKRHWSGYMQCRDLHMGDETLIGAFVREFPLDGGPSEDEALRLPDGTRGVRLVTMSTSDCRISFGTDRRAFT